MLFPPLTSSLFAVPCYGRQLLPSPPSPLQPGKLLPRLHVCPITNRRTNVKQCSAAKNEMNTQDKPDYIAVLRTKLYPVCTSVSKTECAFV